MAPKKLQRETMGEDMVPGTKFGLKYKSARRNMRQVSQASDTTETAEDTDKEEEKETENGNKRNKYRLEISGLLHPDDLMTRKEQKWKRKGKAGQPSSKQPEDIIQLVRSKHHLLYGVKQLEASQDATTPLCPPLQPGGSQVEFHFCPAGSEKEVVGDGPFDSILNNQSSASFGHPGSQSQAWNTSDDDVIFQPLLKSDFNGNGRDLLQDQDLRRYEPDLYQNGSDLRHVGPDFLQNGLDLRHREEDFFQNGSDLRHKEPDFLQNGSDLHRKVPDFFQNGSDLHQREPDFFQNGPDLHHSEPAPDPDFIQPDLPPNPTDLFHPGEDYPPCKHRRRRRRKKSPPTAPHPHVNKGDLCPYFQADYGPDFKPRCASNLGTFRASNVPRAGPASSSSFSSSFSSSSANRGGPTPSSSSFFPSSSSSFSVPKGDPATSSFSFFPSFSSFPSSSPSSSSFSVPKGPPTSSSSSSFFPSSSSSFREPLDQESPTPIWNHREEERLTSPRISVTHAEDSCHSGQNTFLKVSLVEGELALDPKDWTLGHKFTGILGRKTEFVSHVPGDLMNGQPSLATEELLQLYTLP